MTNDKPPLQSATTLTFLPRWGCPVSSNLSSLLKILQRFYSTDNSFAVPFQKKSNLTEGSKQFFNWYCITDEVISYDGKDHVMYRGCQQLGPGVEDGCEYGEVEDGRGRACVCGTDRCNTGKMTNFGGRFVAGWKLLGFLCFFGLAFKL